MVRDREDTHQSILVEGAQGTHVLDKGYIIQLYRCVPGEGAANPEYCQWLLRQLASLNVLDTVAVVEPLDPIEKHPL